MLRFRAVVSRLFRQRWLLLAIIGIVALSASFYLLVPRGEQVANTVSETRINFDNYEKTRSLSAGHDSGSPPVPADGTQEDCIAKLRKRGVVIHAGPCVDIEDIISNLETGEYVFNKPDKGLVDQSFPFVLVLKTAKGQDAGPIIGAAPGSTVEKQAKFARLLEAAVSGPDLTIDPSGLQQRTATTLDPVEWRWTITPRAAGKKTLTIDVAANLIIGAEKTRVQLKVFREDIDIQVGLLQWMKATVTELNAVTGSILALFGTLGSLFAFVAPFRQWVMKRFERTSAT